MILSENFVLPIDVQITPYMNHVAWRDGGGGGGSVKVVWLIGALDFGKMASSTSTWGWFSSSELDTRFRFSLGFGGIFAVFVK